MKWEKLFTTQIVERGYEYYCEGMVDSFEVTVEGIHGLVMGSEEYDVSISLVEGDVDEMSCSCPYARGGKHCKHMAAVLFAWSSQTGELERTSKWRIDNDEDFQSRLAEIDGLVEEADSETVRSFLKGVLAADERWYHRFCQTVKQVDDEDELLDYRLILDALVHEYAGDDGFIDYKEAGDFAIELHDILD
ncbi:SWIM zinc finger family protein [Enterococcus italicus]|uniref:SWIM zinc finger family protein n=1 Tax=Enterococcus italicus TaxID=246144 RepID=UPI002072E198|nr:SWIM zinc finger family protein [Enterococcus italicus]MCM6881822.1 SWIM zinc finger family protein [Enterococcus italicus]